eukprot:2195917-Rhodomonas_salina.1
MQRLGLSRDEDRRASTARIKRRGDVCVKVRITSRGQNLAVFPAGDQRARSLERHALDLRHKTPSVSDLTGIAFDSRQSAHAHTQHGQVLILRSDHEQYM